MAVGVWRLDLPADEEAAGFVSGWLSAGMKGVLKGLIGNHGMYGVINWNVMLRVACI